MLKMRDSAKSFWMKRSKSQKGIFLGSIAIVLFLAIGLTFFANKSNLVPLYSNLSLQEVGQIKTELDTRGIQYSIEDGGTTIMVPETEVNNLLVDLAGQGIPNSGNIDYSFFSENASWGITDNEFSMIKLDAMQTELANLIKGVKGIEDAKVMINMPKDPVFVSDSGQKASASIVINTQPGYEFQGNQIETLYHLISKAVPKLPHENIVIMNQYFEYFDRNAKGVANNQDAFTNQQSVKDDIERDIRRRLQQMLGTMVGAENVIVSVTSDVDFTKENRVEEIVEPVNVESMEGLPVSIETVHETYSGNPPVDGGVAGTGEEDITGYQATDADGDGEYELVKETINNEYNKIRKEIVESPYKIRDLGIQVAVNNVKSREGDQVEYLSTDEVETVEQGISSILSSIITTSVDAGYGEIQPEEKISIVFQEFSESTKLPETSTPTIPLWMYIAGGVLLLVIIVLVIMLLRNKKDTEEEVVEETLTTEEPTEIPEIKQEKDSESVVRRKQLEKMATDKPEEFAKLLRSWISED